jgi:hypothetical protein
MGSGARDGEETSLVSPRSSRRFLSLMSRRRARQSVVLASSVPEGPVLEGSRCAPPRRSSNLEFTSFTTWSGSAKWVT